MTSFPAWHYLYKYQKPTELWDINSRFYQINEHTSVIYHSLIEVIRFMKHVGYIVTRY